MTREEVFERLNKVFRDVFDDDDITVTETTTSADIDVWDSLEHINLVAAVEQSVDLRPAAIIRKFDLRRPIYKELAAYGHMGREDLGVKWEECDIADRLAELCK